MSHRLGSRPKSEVDRADRTDALFDRVVDEADTVGRRLLLDEVVVLNMPVAHSIAWRFRDRGCALEDLEQTACMALIRAARDFDPSRGHHFLSYAVPCISGAVKRYFRDSGWTVRPPRAVQELQQRLVVAGRHADPSGGTAPTTQQLADSLGVDVEAVGEALQARGCFTPTSLDLTINDGDLTVLGDLLVAGDDGGMQAAEARVVLRPALARLGPADRAVLTMRFVEQQTQQQMAQELGTTQPSVSRLLNRILKEMHTMVTETHLGSTASPASAA